MIKNIMSSVVLILACSISFSQSNYRNQSVLTLEKITQGEAWTGTFPDQITWSPDSRKIYFTWNPEKEVEATWHSTDIKKGNPVQLTPEQRAQMPSPYGSFNKDHSLYVYSGDKGLFLVNTLKGGTQCLIQTTDDIRSPYFSVKGDKIYFVWNSDLYSYSIAGGKVVRYTEFREGSKENEDPQNPEDIWLKNQQMQLFQVLRDRKEQESFRSEQEKELSGSHLPKTIYTGRARVFRVNISPDERYLAFQLFTPGKGERTKLPVYLNETGYTNIETSRTKVGFSYGSSEVKLYDLVKDSLVTLSVKNLDGIRDIPAYRREYGDTARQGKERQVFMDMPVWSDSSQAVMEINSADNKDRWIVLVKPLTGKLMVLDRQTDTAWISELVSGSWYERPKMGWMPDNEHVYFLSEQTGYCHLYTVDIKTGEKKALTSGQFEIYDPFISKDHTYWYFTSNEVASGEHHFYRMPLGGGERTRLTSMTGNNDVQLSPDEKWLAIRYSYTNKPWELYLQENKHGAVLSKITSSGSAEFNAYPWRDPRNIYFKASDGVMVPGLLLSPDPAKKNGAAVIFVHGAGYLQNVHRWWSYYYHEYMFDNFLVDNGYTVMEIDYRGSAGYGRDWRTAIYRYMGGRDLMDAVDGAAWLVKECGIDSSRLGIYGGSYGGFLTLMAMFRTPGVFACGAALRPVTDWAHYNHGYTSDILNTPTEDSIAYKRSSPIYLADGLQGRLLICHGIKDDNVHFQDAVRLVQRLIELHKDSWELAVYPVERHAFSEKSSWLDEYKRIYRLFEEAIGPEAHK